VEIDGTLRIIFAEGRGSTRALQVCIEDEETPVFAEPRQAVSITDTRRGWSVILS